LIYTGKLHDLVIQIALADEGVKMIAKRFRIQKSIIGVGRDTTVDEFPTVLEADVEMVGIEVITGRFDQL